MSDETTARAWAAWRKKMRDQLQRQASKAQEWARAARRTEQAIFDSYPAERDGGEPPA